MNTPLSLTGLSLKTYQTIFQHPASHNLKWHDVYTLFRHIGQVEEQANGNMKVIRNGQVLVLHPSRTKDLAEIDELMTLRHFLDRSSTTETESNGREPHWLLVIDHHVARLFRAEVNGGVPHRILPHDADEYFRHAHNSKDFSRGQEKPDPNSFFEPVAKALQAPGHILVFGSGTGTSSEMDQFIAWLNTHHPDLARRVIGSVVVDEGHLTDNQLLAKAGEFYSHALVSHA